MTKINIWFKNFWPQFNPYNNSFIKYVSYYLAKNGYKVVVSPDKPKIIFYSVFSDVITDGYSFNKNIIKILYIRENIYSNWYKDIYPINLNKFAYIIGYEDNEQLNKYYLSEHFIRGQLYNSNSYRYQEILSNNTTPFPDKNNKICFIHSNLNHIRKYILNQFKINNIDIDDLDVIKNSTNILNIDKYITKYEILPSYTFNLCLENSYYTGYTTEKLFDASICGCIPIYWGCKNLANNFYNRDKVLLLDQDLQNLNEIIRQIKLLQSNKELLKQKLSLLPYNNNLLSIINEENDRHSRLFSRIIYENKL